MFKESRIIASSIFLGALVLTLLSCFFLRVRILILSFLILQMGAYIWYMASYIPFGRKMIKTCLGNCMSSS